MRIALKIEYKGTHYHGWEKQKGDLPTIQLALETALSKIANHPIETTVAGRTDAGVHATGQVVHFDTDVIRNTESWTRGTNSHLPRDITVLDAQIVDDDFSARFNATARSYQYQIINRLQRVSLEADLVYWTHTPLDVLAMHTAAQHLIGEHDFSAFRAASCQANTPHRNMHHINITQDGNRITTSITGNAFLHHMVRNIMGTLMDVGTGKQNPAWVKEVLESKNRSNAGQTAAARGLSLTQVHYDMLEFNDGTLQ